ncbi:hypothetical protein APTSU1_001250900 [Apodemus speciosus]|uniref:Uncharacterized protein n=1 Tax=Apodemus speciosus TaxID=105296 RepID=A0ABQ0FDE7_APOSI
MKTPTFRLSTYSKIVRIIDLKGGESDPTSAVSGHPAFLHPRSCPPERCL